MDHEEHVGPFHEHYGQLDASVVLADPGDSSVFDDRFRGVHDIEGVGLADAVTAGGSGEPDRFHPPIMPCKKVVQGTSGSGSSVEDAREQGVGGCEADGEVAAVAPPSRETELSQMVCSQFDRLHRSGTCADHSQAPGNSIGDEIDELVWQRTLQCANLGRLRGICERVGDRHTDLLNP